MQSIEIFSNFVLNLKEIITLRLPNPWYNFAFAIIFDYLAFKTTHAHIYTYTYIYVYIYAYIYSGLVMEQN